MLAKGLLDKPPQRKWINSLSKLMRDPTDSELAYFKTNPHVAGMATEDNAITLNPYSGLADEQQMAVAKNEYARLMMRFMPNSEKPKFPLTTKQRETFRGYGTQQDQRETIMGRLYSRDSSAGHPSMDQLLYLNRLMKKR